MVAAGFARIVDLALRGGVAELGAGAAEIFWGLALIGPTEVLIQMPTLNSLLAFASESAWAILMLSIGTLHVATAKWPPGLMRRATLLFGSFFWLFIALQSAQVAGFSLGAALTLPYSLMLMLTYYRLERNGPGGRTWTQL